jgi:PKD domain-containing protein
MKRTLTCLVFLAALVVAAPAAADVTVEGTGEPAFTNSTNNTQWIRWQAPEGNDGYRLHARYYRDNVQVHEFTWTVGASGTTWIDWSGVATLEHGRQYGICVTGEFSLPNDSLWFSDGPNSCSNGTNEGKRSYTTIDRSKPSVSVAAAGGADFTKQETIPVSIGFQDDVAGPNPANFVCVAAGTDPCSGLQYLSDCSVPGGPGKSTTFNCGVDASELPDGPVTVCAIAADAAVPNNPSSANQTASATQANLSTSQCDTVVLDRQGPTLAVNASKTVVLVGEQVSLSPQASDSGAGLDASASRWEFGDGASAMTGGATTHSYDQPGTYVVSFHTRDKAGNESTAEKSITVQAPPGGGTTTPNVPITNGGPLAGVRIGGVRVIVPKAVRRGKVKQLVLRAHAEQAGTLALRLTRGKKVLSRLTVGLAPGETTQRLRLPKGLKRGTYTVKIAFKAKGASYTAAGAARISVK